MGSASAPTHTINNKNNISPTYFFFIKTHSRRFAKRKLNRRSLKLRTMATSVTTRYASRRLFSNGSGRRPFSSGSGKVLGEEEKAAENAYFKKAEQEKLEKLARQGPQPGAKPETGSSGSVTDAKPASSGHTGTSSDKVSTDKYRNYAVVAGTVTILGALGWYLKGTAKKPEVQD